MPEQTPDPRRTGGFIVLHDGTRIPVGVLVDDEPDELGRVVAWFQLARDLTDDERGQLRFARVEFAVLDDRLTGPDALVVRFGSPKDWFGGGQTPLTTVTRQPDDPAEGAADGA